MKVEINDIALSKNVKKLLTNLIKTANKYSKFKFKAITVEFKFKNNNCQIPNSKTITVKFQIQKQIFKIQNSKTIIQNSNLKQ